MKLIELPPPRHLPDGTMDSRPASSFEASALCNVAVFESGTMFVRYRAGLMI